MKWYSKLYIGKNIGRDREKIREELEEGRAPLRVYLLCLPSNPRERMDIVPAYVLEQTGEMLREWEILGLAKGKEEAFSLAGEFLREVYDKTGGFDVRAFVEGQMR